ncbi:MAG TPA: hypothetical protein VMT01_03870 [Candidatus Acidoferrum sp.]|jgi:hypothetical protein|nr:hypothetical protein [Candidatus Acidoferrum sp.]
MSIHKGLLDPCHNPSLGVKKGEITQAKWFAPLYYVFRFTATKT